MNNKSFFRTLTFVSILFILFGKFSHVGLTTLSDWTSLLDTSSGMTLGILAFLGVYGSAWVLLSISEDRKKGYATESSL